MWFAAATAVLAQSVPGTTFPIPPDLKTDRGLVPLSHLDVSADLLAKAMRKDLDWEFDGGKVSLDDFLFAQLPLGKLGRGTLVKAKWGSRACGKGNCPFWIYVLRNGRYEQILGTPWPKGSVPRTTNDALGWAYSNTRTPNLFIMANGGGGHQFLIRYGLQDGRLIEDGCEELTAKDPESEPNWFDSSQLNITACRK